ncbi:M1 family metallopeptidase [Mycolicibacterium thermoresistibile]
MIDPYVPASGNDGYRVSHYELDLNYKVAINRLSGTARISAVTTDALDVFSLDLSDALKVTKVTLNGRRPRGFRAVDNKLLIAAASPLPAGAEVTITVGYRGSPRPHRTVWGAVGFEELTDGALVAGQPNGASSWYPCNDHPAAKAGYRIRISTENDYRVICNGRLTSRRAGPGQTTWTYEQPEPTSSYLVTVQIGRYDTVPMTDTPVPMRAALPPRLRAVFEHDFARQPQMMELFVELFGPYPLDSGYTVVVADDDLEIPLEAQGVSIFGANHCDGECGAERLIAHELAHQWFGNSVTARRWRDIWLHEGFACYAEWLWFDRLHARGDGGRAVDESARHYHRRLRSAPQDLVLADPGARDMFDDRVYKRGALTLHALRRHIGDERFFSLLQEWARRHRHGNVDTDDFTALAADYTDEPLQPLWDAWLYATAVPEL